MNAQETNTISDTEAVRRERSTDDQISTKLLQIWQEFLGVESLSADQNYFDLGGDSALAVQMFARIEQVLAVKLPLATLYEAPTVNELAEVIRGEMFSSRWSPLVAIQPEGTRPPFFCVHPHGGNVLVYRELSKLLGQDQPFFGLQSPGLDGGQPPIETIEDMAALYVREIRRAQPRGPYFLGGYCMGGAVAYEIACQLCEAGEEVALLALFDSMEFSTFKMPSFLQMSFYNCQRLVFHLSNLLRLSSEDGSRFLSEKVRSLRLRLPVWLAGINAKRRSGSPKDEPKSEAEILDKIWKANFDAYVKYKAKRYSGVVTDIRPSSQYRLFDQSRLKWDRFATGQHVVVLPVNPPAMLSDPFVKYLAQALQQCMNENIEANHSWANHASNISS